MKSPQPTLTCVFAFVVTHLLLLSCFTTDVSEAVPARLSYMRDADGGLYLMKREPMANSADIRNCWFSPVQCLLPVNAKVMRSFANRPHSI
ncbi:hypothetical protein AAVH_03593 [Aphelenchoides avenae]|nr:hypothetical protein AAVH_35346 [Aphelenchus avenae]KAH7729211.1 hypothetical protein AAVH_03593 [Aphelenchus avenae]